LLKSLGKLVLAAPLVLAACVQDAGVPDLGPCSIPPDQDLFEYGQIDIGTCISSPSDLQIRPDPQSVDNHFLFVVNTDAYSNFTGSSLLSIDASSIDLSCPVNGMHEVSATALGMQEFAGRLGIDESRDLGLLSARVNGQMDGDLTDVVFTVDVADPRALSFSDRGPRSWGPFRYVQVPADPWTVRVNPANGRAYVLGLTTHTVSALDLVSDPVQFLDLRGDMSVGSATFTDVDSSGSTPDFSIESVITTQVEDEVVTLTFQEGTTRLFFSVDDGDSLSLMAGNAGDGVTFVEQAGGAVVTPDPAITWAAGGLADAAVGILGDGLAALATGLDASGKRSIGRMSAADHALDWTVASTEAIPPSVNGAAWDTTGTFDPDWLIQSDGTVRAYFSGGPGWGTAIGHASGAGLSALTRSGDEALPDGLAAGQVLAASDVAGDWDSAAVFAPAIIGDGASGLLHLYYTGHDGVAVGDLPGLPAIGLATSADGLVFDRTGPVIEPGEAGAWDGLGVGWPTVFFDNGRWQIWYRGYDGVSWRVGRATSIDGKTWTKDLRNPVSGDFLEATGDAPLRVFAQKVSPVSGYQITGEVTGDLPFLASEGTSYEATASPIGFLVVGGQALGRGPAGSYDRDGAAGAGRAGQTDFIVYSALQGSRGRLALARDLGAGAERLSSLPGVGWTGVFEDLNGDTPALALDAPDVQVDGTDLVLTFETSQGIGLGTLDVDAEGTPVSFSPLLADPLLAGGEDAFDSGRVGAPSLLLDGHDGSARLFYEGSRGESSSIGMATASALGEPFQRSETEAFARGGAGAWDDASIGSPSVLWDATEELYRLWYLGSDGETHRLGLATSTDATTWSRTVDSEGVGVPVFDGVGLPFVGSEGLHSARVRALADGGFELWFEGNLDGVPRIGRAISSDGISWSTITNPTTAGDTFTLETRAGDEDASTGIHLGEPPQQGEDETDIVSIGGFRVHGAGVSEMILSPDGQYAVVANKRTNVLAVLDLRDDSTDEWTDANVNRVEAAIRIPQRYGIVGTRDMKFSPDGTKLHVLLAPMVFSEAGENELRTGTEAFLTIDWTLVEDTADGSLIFDDAVLSFTPLPRGREEDVGYRSDVSVGPSALALSADGSRAYVTNYNDNSMWILNLNAGARGAVIERVQPLDEGPANIALSPDGKLAYIGNYLGWSRDLVVHSTIQVVDIDEASPTFGEILTTLTNIESRSDRGCE